MNVSINHPTDRPNFSVVQVSGLTLWFSYSTVIAFQPRGSHKTIVSENIWGPTTGKHINYVSSDKEARVPRKEFEAHLSVELGE